MLFKVSPYGFCFNLIAFSTSYMMAHILGEKLYVYEKSNSISPKIKILQEILKENDKVIYIDTLQGYEKEYEYNDASDNIVIRQNLSKEEKHKLISECLVLNEATYAKLGELPTYDIAIHCRTGDKITWGEMGIITIDKYIEAVASIKDLPTEPSIFLMTDNGQVVSDFKTKAPSSWRIFSFTPEVSEAYDQFKFNDKTAKQKLADLYQLLKELEIAKKCRHFIGTSSSNVGMYIILTHPGKYGVDFFPQSLDYPIEMLF